MKYTLEFKPTPETFKFDQPKQRDDRWLWFLLGGIFANVIWIIILNF